MTDALSEVRAQWQRLRPELDTLPIETVGRINLISRIQQRRSDALLADFGFIRGEFDILAALVRSDHPLMPGEIADALRVSPPVVTKWTHRLVAAGYIERQSHPTDGRGAVLSPTERAREAVHAMLPVQLSAEAGPLSRLTPDQRAALNAGLELLLAAMECADD